MSDTHGSAQRCNHPAEERLPYQSTSLGGLSIARPAGRNAQPQWERRGHSDHPAAYRVSARGRSIRAAPRRSDRLDVRIFLQPRIMSHAVGVPGVTVIVALIIGYELAGVTGTLVSVPTAVLIAELKAELLK